MLGLKSDYLRAFLSKANGFTGFPSIPLLHTSAGFANRVLKNNEANHDRSVNASYILCRRKATNKKTGG